MEFAHLLHLDENDRNLLTRIGQSLPLLADLARADVLIYVATDAADSAIVAAEAKPNTVPPIYREPVVDRRVNRVEEPAVLRAITRGDKVQRVSRMLVHGHPTIQDVYPIRNNERIIAAMSVEVGLLEAQRQRRKSIVYRRAIAQLRRMVRFGRLEGPSNISPLGEHDGPLVLDDKGEILYISSIAENLYRKLGYTHSLLQANVANLRTDESAFFKAIETGTCVEEVIEEEHLTWVKKAIPLVAEVRHGWSSRLLRRSGEIDGAIIVIHDVTEEREKDQALKIKTAMIQEIHHRVKNNLQTIAALLRLQARRTGSVEVNEILRESINRILSIAFVHEFLSHDELSIVNVREVCQRIITEVARSVLDPEKRIRFNLEGIDVFLPTQQATSCALIVNELLQNAVEHGFGSRSEGMVLISLQDKGDRVVLEIVDDGQGLTANYDEGGATSLGLQIVRTLVREDLKGSFELQNIDGRGARAIVSFPKHLPLVHVPREGARDSSRRRGLPTDSLVDLLGNR